MNNSTLRMAEPADLVQIMAIYNHAVTETTAIWNDTPVDLDNRERWYADRIGRGFPILVAVNGPQVLGFASYGDWRAFDGFRGTVENSVYVAPDMQGQGVGRLLLTALIDAARVQGKHVMIAGIEAGNAGSIHLHESLGFRETARMEQVGQKFGRWLDLVFLQLQLDERPNPLL
jgi:L-amino acid N-acyltransferase